MNLVEDFDGETNFYGDKRHFRILRWTRQPDEVNPWKKDLVENFTRETRHFCGAKSHYMQSRSCIGCL